MTVVLWWRPRTGKNIVSTFDIAMDNKIVVQEVQPLKDLSCISSRNIVGEGTIVPQAVAQRALRASGATNAYIPRAHTP